MKVSFGKIMTGTPIGGRVATVANPLRCAVLISGAGSGMQALVKAQQHHGLSHTTSVVISNRSEAGGVQLAEELGVEVKLVLPPKGTENTRAAHEDLIMEILEQYDIEFVVLSGYMRLLSPHLLESWRGRVVNIHPSYLPHFPGAHAHRDVLVSGAKLTGCTVHMVDEGMDSGTILAQEIVPVLSGDDEVSLSNRVKVEEHRLYPRVLSWIAQGFVTMKSGKVHLDVPQVLHND